MAYEQEITAAASRYGIDPRIPLAVAQHESGRSQYTSKGNLIVGKAGEIGIFQIMPSTAPGENLADPLVNIDVGVRLLRDLFREFGTWPLALAAYNWGSGKVKRALQTGAAIPGVVLSYVSAVLGPGALPGGRAAPFPAPEPALAGISMTPTTVALGVLAGVAVLLVLRR